MHFLLELAWGEIRKIWIAIKNLMGDMTALRALVASLQSGVIPVANQAVAESYAVARALPLSPTPVAVFVLGEVAPRDGGQGIFTWDPFSVAADDNYTVLALTANGANPGRLIRTNFPAA